MKVLVCSDSHSNLTYIRKLCQKAKDDAYDQVWHLGDNYSDALPFIEAGIACIRVPGTWSEFYQDLRIDNRRIELIGHWRCLLTHTPSIDSHDLHSDPDPQQLIESNSIDIMCHGHTHKPEITTTKNGVHVLNPGHIKQSQDRGYPATYASIQLDEESLSITIIQADTGEIYLEKRVIGAGA